MTREEIANYQDVKYWLWASLDQVESLKRAYDEQIETIRSAESGTTYSIQNQQIYARASFTVHFLLIALYNLKKATDKRLIPEQIKNKKLKPDMVYKIKHLRNIHEHWEKTRVAFAKGLKKNKSAKWYDDNYPGQTPWSMSQDARGFIICGILNIAELSEALLELNTAVSIMGW